MDLVIFDCDGVLVDSEPICARVLVELAGGLGLELEFEQASRTFRGRKLDECVWEIERGLGRAVPSDFVESFRQRSNADLAEHVKPVRGIEEAIDRLAIPYCVASGAPEPKIELCLTATGLLPRFAGRVFSSYTVGSWKPDPGLFLHAARVMGAHPERSVVVEDSVPGVIAARRAGMRVLGYAGASDGAELAIEGAYVFHSMGDLHLLLEGIQQL